MPVHVETMKLALLLLMLSDCLVDFVSARGVAMVGKAGNREDMKPHYIDRTYGETDHWYWVNRFGSALVAGGILAALVVSTCCICCCLHYKRRKAEERRRQEEEEGEEKRKDREDSGRGHDEGRRVSSNTNTY